MFGSYWYALQLPTHYQQFTGHTIRSLLAETGFRLVKLIHQRNVLNITGSLALWLREAVPRRASGDRGSCSSPTILRCGAIWHSHRRQGSCRGCYKAVG